MRFAFITRGFTGSILPLMKQMITDGHQVDLYFLCNRKNLDDLEALDCNYMASVIGLRNVPPIYWDATYHFCGATKVRLFCIRLLRPFESVPVLRKAIRLINTCISFKAADFINKQFYDMVNIVGGYYSSEYLPFIERLALKPIISLHEVCNHFNPDFSNPSPLLKSVFDKKLQVILYSDNSYQTILNYMGVDKTCLHRINFGLFSSYIVVKKDDELQLPEQYILFFGTLKKYKGLGVLYNAIEEYDVLPASVKCVVAGAGSDESFEKMKLDDRFVCIQKRLSDGELVRLIEDSLFVVCPYLSVSQSGIPQTVFVFKKPIVASKLGGFTEILNDANSFLFETGNAFELAESIKHLLSDKRKRQSIVEGIENFEEPSNPFSWSYIAKQYYDLLNKSRV